MVDGKFYDAGAYKASPVPFALWGETVYEGREDRRPAGLVHGRRGHAHRLQQLVWRGKWRPAGSEPKKQSHSDQAEDGDEDEGPPKIASRGIRQT